MKICPACDVGAYGSPTRCEACGADLTDVDDRTGLDLVGMVIQDKYELTELIGEGAMGWVYRGIHRALQSSIAVKLLKPSAEPDDTRDKRFEQEARSASGLNSPNIISIIDFGRTPGGILYIVSEFLRGDTLAELIEHQGGPLPLPRALRIIDQILSAVYEAHEAQLVHRDMKPDNVIITPLRSGEDFVKVLDFGIAKLGGEQSQRLTMQGQLFGTPAYMAPEQIRGQEVTPRTDLYACAMMLYEMLTGFEPFRSESVMEVLSMQLHNDPTPLREVPAASHLPVELEAVVMKGLSKAPEGRFADAAEFRQALGQFVGRRPRITTARCSACGSPMALGSKFCPDCGHRKNEMNIPVTDPSISHISATIAAGSSTELADTEQNSKPSATARSATSGPHSTLQRRLKAEKTLSFQLVGRDAEIDQLGGLFEGELRIAELLGPDGSGRSALLEVAAQLAERKGLRVLRAGPDPALTRIPWYPVHTLVGQLLGLDSHKPDLAVLQERAVGAGLDPGDIPGLAELFGIGLLEGRVEYAVRQREVRAAATRTLLDIQAASGGLCLLLDDADEFDGASRALVNQLCQAKPDWPLYVILASESSIIQTACGQLTLEPQPLTGSEVESLMAGALQRQSDSWGQLVETITERSQGLPFAVTQSIRLVAEGGNEVDANPADVITTRVGRLPGGALRLLQTLCVLGSQAPMTLVKKLHAQDDQLSEALQLLGRRGFIGEDTKPVLSVAHPAIAEHVRERMPADARRQLHLRVFELLDADGAGAITLARHALASQDAETTLKMLILAGKQAESWLDDSGAAYQFQQALQVARYRLLYEPDHEICLDLTLRLAQTLRFSGDSQGSQLVLKDALLVSEPNPPMHARLLKTLALGFADRAASQEAVRTMEQAVRSAILGMDPELLNEMYIELGKMLTGLGKWSTASEELTEGVLLVTGGDGPQSQSAPRSFWRLLSQLAQIQFQEQAADQSVATAYHALDQAQREKTLIGQARCHHQLSQFLDRMDREGAAEEHHSSALAAFRRLGDRRSTAECMIGHAAKRPQEHADLLREAQILAQQIGWEEGVQAAAVLADQT
jgi:eukaryotic-like serine/threonine-protein kinase